MEAKRYEFPHHALLGFENSKSGKVTWGCSGSLVSPNFVLTGKKIFKFTNFLLTLTIFELLAAQCYLDSATLRTVLKYVKLGMSKRSQTDERVLTYEIEEIFRHPHFWLDRSISVQNDIALLKLNETVKFNEYLYPICLPTKQPEDKKAVLTGFGHTEKNEVSDALLKITLEKFSHSECQNLFETFKVNPDSQLCFGNQTGFPGGCKVSRFVCKFSKIILKIYFVDV